MLKIAACLGIVAILSSCSNAPLIWNENAKNQEDLRYLRQRNRPSVELARGVALYADAFHFTEFEVTGPTRSDFSKSHPPAGNVIQGTPAAPPAAVKPFTASQHKRNP